jgi:DNA-binding MarR family transcriptional regulator
MDFIKRHPEHDQEWLTVQQGQLAVTPANIRAFLRSMQEAGVVSRAELTTT